MILKSLYMSLDEYGPSKGRYTGKATFASPLGDVSINLSPTVSTQILRAVADQIVNSAQEVAAIMTSEVLDSVANSNSTPKLTSGVAAE